MSKFKSFLTRNRTIVLIVVFIISIFIIVGIRELVMKRVEDNNLQNKTYTSLEDFETMKDVCKYTNSEYIQQKNSKENDYTFDIYVTFGKEIRQGNIIHKEYYNEFIKLSAYVLNYRNFRLIDDEKQLLISVVCDSEKRILLRTYINGDDNYFGTLESQLSVNSYTKTNETNMNIQAQEVKNLISNSWMSKQVNFGTKESTFHGYDIYFDEGIEVRVVSRKVFNIMFTNKYQENIVSNIKVGTSREDVVNILGTPTFGTVEEEVFGYKGENIYIFFFEDEISVYPVNKDGYSEEFVDLIKEFNNNKRTMKVSTLTSKITDIWDDYDIYQTTNNTVNLIYSLRGVKIQFNITSNHGAILSGNCNEALIQALGVGELNKTVYFELDQDFVYQDAKDRMLKMHEIEEMATLSRYENLHTPEQKIKDNISNEFLVYEKTIDTQNNIFTLQFLSIEGKYPNNELDKNINSYVWIDDYRIIYGVSQEGLYLFDVRTGKVYPLLEGKEAFLIKELNGTILKYDEKEVTISR